MGMILVKGSSSTRPRVALAPPGEGQKQKLYRNKI